MSLKETLRHRRWQPGTWQLLYRILWGVFNGLRFLGQPGYRARQLTAWRYAADQHQPSTFTLPDRYPDLFGYLRQHLSHCPRPRLLSFGCSTGEEVATLGTYLPQANIMGADINHWCLGQARRRWSGQLQYDFVHSRSAAFEHATDFDAICCLAVFQHPHNRHDLARTSSAYPFAQFEAQLRRLDQKLKPGGLLLIDHCDFNFLDVAPVLRTGYRPAPWPDNLVRRDRPIFNRHNQKVASQHIAFRVFIKESAHHPA